jgi:hypothetical protein
MQRTAAWRRHHRARLIRKRLKIILNVWGYADPMRYYARDRTGVPSFRPDLFPWHGRRGALAK